MIMARGPGYDVSVHRFHARWKLAWLVGADLSNGKKRDGDRWNEGGTESRKSIVLHARYYVRYLVTSAEISRAISMALCNEIQWTSVIRLSEGGARKGISKTMNIYIRARIARIIPAERPVFRFSLSLSLSLLAKFARVKAAATSRVALIIR